MNITNVKVSIVSSYGATEVPVYNSTMNMYLQREGVACPTCKQKWDKCIGHRYGLVLPFYYVNPIYAEIIIRMFNSICLVPDGSGCMGIYRNPNANKSLMDNLAASSKKEVCPHCNKPRDCRYSVNKKGSLKYGDKVVDHDAFVHSIHNHDRYFTYVQSYTAFARFDPLNTISNILIFVSPTLRSSSSYIQSEETRLLTAIHTIYATIIWRDTKIEYISALTNTDRYELMYNLIRQLYQIDPPNKKATLTLFQSMQGKTGWFRRNITSIEFDNSMRGTVIGSLTPYGTCGVSKMAENMYIAERVNNINLGTLRDMAFENRIFWIQSRGSNVWEKYQRHIMINIGDTVYRSYVTGDVGLFNRQPTLTWRNLMGHHYIMHDHSCTEVHAVNTTPYNADHDGDDMNCIAPKDFKSMLEATSIMHTINALAGCSMGIVFHELIVCLILSRKYDETVIEPEKYWEVLNRHKTLELKERLSTYRARRARVLNIEFNDDYIITYRDVLSLCLPSDTFYTKKGVVVREGIFVSGELTKETIGVSRGSLYARFFMWCSNKRIAHFLEDITSVCRIYMDTNYIGMSIDNLYFAAEDVGTIRRISSPAQHKIADLLRELRKATSHHEEMLIEADISTIADRPALAVANMINTRPINATDTFMTMLKSGARGNVRSATQLCMEVGPQFNGPKRVNAQNLPYIKTTPDRWKAVHAGYVSDSISCGLRPVEFCICSVPCRLAILQGKLTISAAGKAGNDLSTLLSTCKVENDLSIVMGDKQVIWGATLIQTSSIIGDTFIDIALIVEQCNAAVK